MSAPTISDETIRDLRRNAKADATLVRKALVFLEWAAGEGMFIEQPEEIDAADLLFDYSTATDNDDWATFPGLVSDKILALLDALDAERRARVEAERERDEARATAKDVISHLAEERDRTIALEADLASLTRRPWTSTKRVNATSTAGGGTMLLNADGACEAYVTILNCADEAVRDGVHAVLAGERITPAPSEDEALGLVESHAKQLKIWHLERRATTAEAENTRLRTIISEAMSAIGNGSWAAWAAPLCSLEFLALLPAEIKLSREKTEAERDTLAERVKALEAEAEHAAAYLEYLADDLLANQAILREQLLGSRNAE